MWSLRQRLRIKALVSSQNAPLLKLSLKRTRSILWAVQRGGGWPGRSTTCPAAAASPVGSCWTRLCSGPGSRRSCREQKKRRRNIGIRGGALKRSRDRWRWFTSRSHCTRVCPPSHSCRRGSAGPCPAWWNWTWWWWSSPSRTGGRWIRKRKWPLRKTKRDWCVVRNYLSRPAVL